MYRFIESIACIDGYYPLLEKHQERVNRTFKKFYNSSAILHLEPLLPTINTAGKYKMRIAYNELEHTLEQSTYQQKVTHSIKVMEVPKFDYQYKFHDRTQLDHLYEEKGDASDILIICDGKITDSYYANVCLYDGCSWWTPDSFLLNGVKRQSLIETGKVKETALTKSDLLSFQKLSLVNALLDLEEIEIPTDRLIF
ncbi:MAG: 4-amino-4-deoxychorismate lyase [Paraglaciecola sp.]|jgi:4-amino-4-deoxychorismate lyase